MPRRNAKEAKALSHRKNTPTTTRIERKKRQKQQSIMDNLTKYYVRLALGTKSFVWSIGELFTSGEDWIQTLIQLLQ